MDILNSFTSGSFLLTTVEPSTLFYVGVGLFILLVFVGIAIVLNNASKTSTPANIQRVADSQVSLYQSLLLPYSKPKTTLVAQTISASQKALVNFAPLTVYNPGFVGPTDNGAYKEEEAVAAALKAGSRCFILPIDFHENDSLPKPAFPNAGQPCLLYRDAGGNLRSLNAGSIRKVCESLANLAFNDIIPLKGDPFILVLLFMKTPTPNTKEYLRFCGEVSKQLGPLTRFFLSQAPEGVYNRQARQDELLYTPISNLEKKVICMTNIDTSLFRNPKSVGIQSVPTAEDLDFFVHLRLYRQTDASLGATEKASQNQFPRGYIERFSYYTAIPDDRKKDIVEANKIRWIVTVPDDVPEVKVVRTVTEELGVQCVGLPLYAMSEKDTPVLDLWKETGWRPKPEPIRFTRPEPIKPQTPSPKLNANKGQISSPTL